MTRKIDLKNNFLEFTKEFRTDTGLDYKTNIELYIQYYNARMTDRSFQLNWHILY